MAHALVVALAVELRAENGCARKAAEDGEVKDEQKLIDDGDTAHGFGAEAADHNPAKIATTKFILQTSFIFLCIF